jgi:glycosyltransferase involved in cell wall biosynthesis
VLDPTISVVLATCSRARILVQTLDHLRRQDIDPCAYEVIIVDDGSNDDTGRVAQDFIAAAPSCAQYLRHDNQGPAITINRGIRAARGRLVLLLADDIFLMPGALAAHVRWHQTHPDLRVAVLGKAIPSPAMAGSNFLSGWDAFGLARFDHLERLPFIMFWTFSVSFKREFMLAHGMFREVPKPLTVTGHDDTELGYKLHEHGMVLLYAKDALCHHHHPITMTQATQRYVERGRHFPGLMAHAPDSRIKVFFRVVEWGSLGEYYVALRGCHWLSGRERSFAWHLLRHAIRHMLFNRLTVPALWRPLLTRVDRIAKPSGFLAKLFGPYLFYHFLSGIRDARQLSRRNSL